MKCAGGNYVDNSRAAGTLSIRSEAYRLDNKFKLAMADSYEVINSMLGQGAEDDAMRATLRFTTGANAQATTESITTLADYWSRFAQCASSYGDTYQAEQAFHQVVLLDSTNEFAIAGLTVLQQNFEVEETALSKAFTEEARQAPDEPRSHRGLCKFLSRHVVQYVGGEASRPLLRLLQLFAHITSAHAKSRYTPDQATKYIGSYIGKDPRFRFVAAQFFFFQGDLDKTVLQLQEAFRLDALRVRNEAHVSTADSAYNEGRFHRSIDAILVLCANQVGALEEAVGLKQNGKENFDTGKFKLASEFYTQALASLKEKAAGNGKIAARLHFNKAMCMSQINKGAEAILQCNAAIQFDSKYIKAIHKRGIKSALACFISIIFCQY